jgi:DNA-binding HxlR family transcriptional regulator
MSEFFAVPRKDAELALAVRLLDHDTSLDLDVVDALVGQPLRYTDLKPLLRGRSENVLNRALTRLRDEGLIEQRLDLIGKTRVYALTTLGKLVFSRIQQMRPYHEGIQALRRGHAASSP